MYNGTTTVGNSIEIYFKIKNRIVIWSKNSLDQKNWKQGLKWMDQAGNTWTADESGTSHTEQEPAAACPCSREHYSQWLNMEATQVLINR